MISLLQNFVKRSVNSLIENASEKVTQERVAQRNIETMLYVCNAKFLKIKARGKENRFWKFFFIFRFSSSELWSVSWKS
jgi:hypothetical protein